MNISIRIDQRAALLAGRELGPWAEIAITKDLAGPYWPTVVESLDMSVNPPRSSLPAVTANSLEAFLEMLKTRAAEQDRLKVEAKERSAHQIARLRDAVERRESALTAPFEVTEEYTVTKRDSAKLCTGAGPKLRTYVRKLPLTYFTRDAVVSEHRTDFDVLEARYEEAGRRNKEAVAAANARALQEQADVIAAYFDAIEAEANRKKEEDARTKADAERRRLEQAKRSLETGFWEMETPGYDTRQGYKRYWCAKVTYVNGPKGEYEWGDSSSRDGQPGILRVKCTPGEIVAWGLKNFFPKKSLHTLQVMEKDGTMRDVDPKEAYRLYSARQASIRPVAEAGSATKSVPQALQRKRRASVS